MTKQLVILRGAHAGRILTLDDATASAAVADGWGRDQAEHPAVGGVEEGTDFAEIAATEKPQSLIDFEAALNAGATSDNPVMPEQAPGETPAERPKRADRTDRGERATTHHAARAPASPPPSSEEKSGE